MLSFLDPLLGGVSTVFFAVHVLYIRLEMASLSRGFQARSTMAKQSKSVEKPVPIETDESEETSSGFLRAGARMVHLQTLARMINSERKHPTTGDEEDQKCELIEEDVDSTYTDVQRNKRNDPINKPSEDSCTNHKKDDEQEMWLFIKKFINLNDRYSAVTILAFMLFLVIVVMFLTSE